MLACGECASNNSTKSTPTLTADLFGDWREEIIVTLPGELRVYSTTIPTSRRRVALMEDPLYRKDVALQAMGYLYPPQLSYHFR